MKKMNVRTRVLGLMVPVALLGGVAFGASGQTGAYFSQTVQGGVTGTVGSIHITPSTATNISFSNLLPGAPQSVSVSYENTGSSPEDVYIKFNNFTALSALNNLGRYGAVHISSDGYGAVGDVFDSFNLNDNSSQMRTALREHTAIRAVFSLLAGAESTLAGKHVASGATGSFTFTFEYASALSTQSGNFTDPWNTYPTAASVACTPSPSAYSPSCTNGQFVVNPADGSGAGLPFQIVATKVGITPGQAGSKF